MAYPKEARFETLRSLNFTGIGAAYNAIGNEFTAPVRLLGITNLTDQNLIFSLDGVNDQIIVPSGMGKVFDVTTNRTNQENMFISEGQFIFVKDTGVAPTSGSCYVETVIGVY